MPTLTATCLGDALWIPDGKLPGENFLCKYALTKKVERDMMLQMPANHSFVDVGAHNGDTVLAMALHAKKRARHDIRFFAFEPDVTKAQYIQTVANMNNLNVSVFALAIGDITQSVQQTGDVPIQSGAVAYKAVDKGGVQMQPLDVFFEAIHPVGHLHLDVEGWESKVIDGAQRVLQNTKACSLLAEAWNPISARKRGFSETPLEDIAQALTKHPHFLNRGFIQDGNNNVLYTSFEVSLDTLIAQYK